MKNSLQAALATLEQARHGMLNGRIASVDELQTAGTEALRTANAELTAATDASPAEAKAFADAFPPWAHSLVDPTLLAALNATAALHSPSPPVDVVIVPGLGAFSWFTDAGCYVGDRPLSVGATAITLSVSDVDPKDLPKRIRAFPWLPSQLDKVINAAQAFAAENCLEMHNSGYVEAGEPPTTRNEFCERLTPTYLALENDCALLTFDDGDLFWGHHLVVTCDHAGACTELSVAG